MNTEPPVATRRSRPSLTIVVMAIVVALVVAGALVAWPLGGWQTVALTRDRIEEFAVDAGVEANPFVVTVHGATISTVNASGYGEPRNEGDVFLTVEATVESTWAEPLHVYTFDDWLLTFDRLTELDDHAAVPDIRRADDQSGSVQAGPGVVVPVMVTWEVPGDWYADGDELALTVSESRSRTSSLDSAVTVWRTTGAVGVVVCPIRELVAPDEDEA